MCINVRVRDLLRSRILWRIFNNHTVIIFITNRLLNIPRGGSVLMFHPPPHEYALDKGINGPFLKKKCNVSEKKIVLLWKLHSFFNFFDVCLFPLPTTNVFRYMIYDTLRSTNPKSWKRGKGRTLIRKCIRTILE